MDNRELVGNTELKYAANSKVYHLEFDNILLSKEHVSVINMMIGCRAFGKMEMLELVNKLKCFTSYNDKLQAEAEESTTRYYLGGI